MKDKEKATVLLLLVVMYTLCNSKKYCNATGVREAVCIMTKKKLTNLYLPFLLHCPVSSGSVPDVFPMPCLNHLMRQKCRFRLGDQNIINNHYSCSPGDFIPASGPMRFSFIFSFTHSYHKDLLNLA